MGGSANLTFAHISAHNIRSMIGGTLALLFISAVLLVFLGSFKHSFISLIPNLLPAITAFGVWGSLVGEVGMVASTVSALTLGIVVDDTIHFINSFLIGVREKQLSSEDAVKYAFKEIGMALFANSLILVFGFMVLAKSSFEINSVMGLLSVITIVVALLADFLFLPPLLMKLENALK